MAGKTSTSVPRGALFRLSSATRHDPDIDAWFAAQQPELGAMALAWFTQMRKCGVDVRETLHDGCPVACVGDAAFGYVNVFATHLNVGFFHGADLDDPDGLLRGTGKRMRHARFEPGIDGGVALAHLVEDAYADVKRRLQDQLQP